MSRATPLPPQERRQAIVDATLPLLLAQGTELSTREIAHAAGVAEGTIFRAFETKDEIITAAVHEAMRPTAAVADLAAIPAGQSLDERVRSVLGILLDEIQRTRSLLLHLAGVGFRPGPPDHRHGPGGPHDSRFVLLTAAAEALKPYQEQLRVPPTIAAQLLSALAFASRFHLDPNSPPTDPELMATVALYGIAEGEK